jgi:hypothetical protein
MLLFKNEHHSLIFPSIKLSELLLLKSEEFEQWEKQIQHSIDILEQQLTKLKQNKTLKSVRQIQLHESQPLFKDDWLNLDDSISDFLEQEAE